MYFLEKARGLGLGTHLINFCIEKAKDFMFEKCYLETMTYMKVAQKLYLKNGFEYFRCPIGQYGALLLSNSHVKKHSTLTIGKCRQSFHQFIRGPILQLKNYNQFFYFLS